MYTLAAVTGGVISRVLSREVAVIKWVSSGLPSDAGRADVIATGM